MLERRVIDRIGNPQLQLLSPFLHVSYYWHWHLTVPNDAKCSAVSATTCSWYNLMVCTLFSRLWTENMRHVAPCCTSFYPHLHSSIRIPYPPADSLECPIGLRQGRASEFVGNLGRPKKNSPESWIMTSLDWGMPRSPQLCWASTPLMLEKFSGHFAKPKRISEDVWGWGGEAFASLKKSGQFVFHQTSPPCFLQAFGGERQRGAWARCWVRSLSEQITLYPF